MLESVLRLKDSLLYMAKEHSHLLSASVLGILADRDTVDMFFITIRQLCLLLTPLTLVIQAVQSDDATLADVMRYWYYLARQIDALKKRLTDADFKAHCISAFNWRVKDIYVCC